MQTGTAAAQGELALTGERTLPGIPDENYWFRRHEAAYRALLPFVLGAHVLEAGAGEGYGADLLRAGGASRVHALDYDAQAAGHLARRYPGVLACRGDLQRMPYADGVFDVLASLQTIEHLHDQPGFVAECARVLRPAGTLLLTTPNRLTFSPGRDTPLNPFHTRELSAGELDELLAPRFHVTRRWGLRHGARLARAERHAGPLVDAQLARPAGDWAPALRRAVHRVGAADFAVDGLDVDRSLDLVVVAWKKP
ncbi:MAG TPA: class I SAM-dependent methyltransferase [Mycobacteriales bacterium]